MAPNIPVMTPTKSTSHIWAKGMGTALEKSNMGARPNTFRQTKFPAIEEAMELTKTSLLKPLFNSSKAKRAPAMGALKAA